MTNTQRTFSALAIAATLAAAPLVGAAVSRADAPHLVTHDYYVDAHGEAWNDVVLLSEVPQIDALPVCHYEDCSDVPAALQPAVWTDHDGDAYVMWTDGPTYLVIDDTTR